MPEQAIHSFDTDALSSFAIDILKIDLDSACTTLVVSGKGNREARTLLEQANAERMIVGSVVNREKAKGMLAGLWLWHDWLDESHRISQDLHSSIGSF